MKEEIIKALKEKNTLLSKLEDICKKMNTDDIDELSTFDDQRMEIIEELKKLDEHVNSIYENANDADIISRVISNEEDVSSVPKEYLPIYECSKENFKIIARLISFQEEYNHHLENLMDSLQDEIKENQKSGKVAKYLNALDDQMAPAGSLLSLGSRKA